MNIEKIKNFTVLAGVLLADVEFPNSGNLTLYPGSHLVIAEVIREMGGADALISLAKKQGKLEFDLLKELVDSKGVGNPVQFCGKAGDVILAHYQTAHTIAPNISSDVRYCVYFRMHHRLHPPESYVPAGNHSLCVYIYF